MLKIDILQDEDLQEIVNRFISALLPHDSYCPSMYSQVLHCIFKYVKLEEFQMEYRLLLSVLNDLNKIRIQFAGSFVPKLERQQFQTCLEMGIMNAVTDPTLGIKDWLAYEGLNNNLDIEGTKEIACQKLCERAMELYDYCFSLGVSAEEILNEEPALKSAFMAHCGTIGINTQRSIILQDTKVGRKKYRGFEDWMKYTSQMLTEIKDRLSNADSDAIVTIKGIEESTNLLKDLSELHVPIAQYGIPEIDDYTPILRHRLVVVVGKENIGKTKFAVDQTVNVMLAGGKAVFMCGETQKAKVYADIIINYVYKKFGCIIRPEHIACIENCPEEIAVIINMAIAEIVGDGKLILADAFDYGTVYDQLQSLYEAEHFDACFIDHSCALVGTAGDGSLKAKVDALSEAVKNFRKVFPVYIMVTSHPSTTAKNTDSQGKVTSDSPTKGSQDLSTDADEVFFIRDDEVYRKQHKVILENTKRRNAGRVDDYIILTKKFEVSAFIYDANDQKLVVKDEVQANKNNELLDSLYASGADESGEYLDD